MELPSGENHAPWNPVIHHRQRLALGLETGDHRLAVHAQLNDLERDPAAHGFSLLGHVNHTAAAFTDPLQKLVASDLVAGFFRGARCDKDSPGRGLGRFRVSCSCRQFFEESSRLIIGLKQFLDPLAQDGIIRAHLVEVGSALASREPAGNAKNGRLAARGCIHGLGHNLLFNNGGQIAIPASEPIRPPFINAKFYTQPGELFLQITFPPNLPKISH